MRWLRRIIVGFLALVGFVVIALVGLGLWLGSSMLYPGARAVPASTVLELDLTKPLAATTTDDLFAELLARDRVSLRQIETALDHAGRDPRVKGLVARLGGAPLGMANTQELRDAVLAFRKRGKFALAFAESYGGGGSGNGDYYLATAFEEIWLQPSGEVGLTGLIAETPFLKGTLDKLGVIPRFDRREEYKSAIEQLTNANYSPAFKESLQDILGSLHDQLVRGIADGRGMGPATVIALVDRGPFLAEEALKEKLIDRLGYRDEWEAAAKGRGAHAALFPLRDYAREAETDAGGRVFALIDGSGPIVSGRGDLDQPFGVGQIGADTMVDALDEAAASRDVAVIVLRLDSPGGSYLASDTIWRAVGRAKTAGKPVIVSMGNVAASGGYFIAAPATKIVAEPGTLTGSIGVFGGKFVIKPLLDNLGISVDRVQLDANAGMWSATQDFTPGGWDRLEALLDAVYRDFTTKVSQGRRLDASRIPRVAKGRVFTGEAAQKLGLVDALGGLSTALALAREAAGIGTEEAVRLRRYPRPGHELRELVRRLLAAEAVTALDSQTRLAERVAARLGSSIAALRPLIAELPALARPGEAWLLMPPLDVR